MTDVPLSPPAELDLQKLNSTHPDYETEEHESLSLIYKGGFEILRPDNAKRFIPMTERHPAAYEQKLQCASYTNMFAKHVDMFATQTFNKVLDVRVKGADTLPDVFAEFVNRATLDGDSLQAVLKQKLTSMMVHKWVLVGADVPSTDVVPLNKAQEQALKKSRTPYLYNIPNTALLDWELNPDGTFASCKLKKTYFAPVSPFESREKMFTDFKIWWMAQGFAHWVIYRVEHSKGQAPVGNATLLGGANKTTFKRIPILRLEVPASLWLGNLIGPMCADHFRMQSSFYFSEQRSLYATPIYKMGAPPEDGGTAVDDNEQRNNDASDTMASRGITTIGENDDMFYLEPSGSCYTLMHQQLQDKQDDVARTCNQMAHTIQSKKGGAAKSAESKMADSDATEIILEEYGREASEAARRILELVASIINQEGLEWDVKGLCDYTVTDREKLIAEALVMPQLVSSINAPTFQENYMQQLALAILHKAPKEVEQKIVKEIAQAVKNGDLPMTHEEEAEDDGEDSSGSDQARSKK